MVATRPSTAPRRILRTLYGEKLRERMTLWSGGNPLRIRRGAHQNNNLGISSQELPKQRCHKGHCMTKRLSRALNSISAELGVQRHAIPRKHQQHPQITPPPRTLYDEKGSPKQGNGWRCVLWRSVGAVPSNTIKTMTWTSPSLGAPPNNAITNHFV